MLGGNGAFPRLQEDFGDVHTADLKSWWCDGFCPRYEFLKSVYASLLAVLVLLLQPGQILAATIEGRVVGVSDGDTITVLDGTKTQHKIRLAGIDAPESKQAFGQASKKHLSDMVFGKEVVLDCGKIDKYRREVCVVMVDGQDANLAQVKAGMAWWYRKYQKEQTPRQRAEYEAAEGAAKAERVGLWGDADAVPPWEWRHR